MHLCLPAMMVCAASVGCRERLKPETAGAVQFALPNWPDRGRLNDPAVGYVEKADKGSRALIAWDIDPRPGAPTAEEARLASGLERADIGMPLLIAGHPAVALQSGQSRALVWRCDRTNRLLRIVTEGPQAPDPAVIAAQTACHQHGMSNNGDVPPAAVSALGAEWRFAHRGRGSAAWVRDDAVLTIFAGQQLPSPRDPEAARRAAPDWVAAAGLSGPIAAAAEPSPGPQGHKGFKVKGIAKLDGRPVRWTLIFWRCLQRQRSFAAVVFARTPEDDRKEDFTGSDNALLAPRCHG